MSKMYRVILIDPNSRAPVKGQPFVDIDSDTMENLIELLNASELKSGNPLLGLTEELETLTKHCTLPEDIQAEICDSLIRTALGTGPAEVPRISRIRERYGREEVDNFIEQVENSSNYWESNFDEFIGEQVSKTLDNLK